MFVAPIGVGLANNVVVDTEPVKQLASKSSTFGKSIYLPTILVLVAVAVLVELGAGVEDECSTLNTELT